MAERIVLFGGSFDPVHHGHLIVAGAVAEQCRFERIALVPAARPPHKPPACASGEDRLAMLRLGITDSQLFDICELELRRDPPSYTFDTLRELREQHGQGVKLYWIIGADMLEDLPNWHRAGEVLEMAEIVIAARGPWEERLDAIFTDLERVFGTETVGALRGSVLPTPLLDISSSDIRRRVAEGLSIRFLVPESVRTYIEEHSLYSTLSP